MTSVDPSLSESLRATGATLGFPRARGQRSPMSHDPIGRGATAPGGGTTAASDSSLRVLLVTEPGVDGVFRHVEALTHFLLGEGHRVDLAYSDVRSSDRLGELVASVGACGGRTLNLAVTNAPGAADLRALLRLRRLVSESGPDVIHGHSSKAGALVRALRWTGVRQPLFYTPHAYYGLCAPPGLKARFFNGIERVLGRVGTTFNLSGCELAYAEHSLRVPRERLRLIPNPVDADRFAPAAPEVRRRLRRELGVPEDALLLGSVGRLAYQKDPFTLYRSLAAASERIKNLWLYHLGTGELAADCARLAAELGIADRIIRRDYLSDPLPFYQAIDAAILTSRYEGLSLAVLEALACDLPAILSEVPGNLDFLQLGLSHAWSAPGGDSGKMAEAITQWAGDHPARRASNHRAIAEQRFSRKLCFGRVVEAYRDPLR
jgi:glycosyltransferase involved in cell wall biosynthesis